MKTLNEKEVVRMAELEEETKMFKVFLDQK